MLIQFKHPDPRAGTTARMDSSRGQHFIDTGAADLVDERAEGAAPLLQPPPAPAPAPAPVKTVRPRKTTPPAPAPAPSAPVVEPSAASPADGLDGAVAESGQGIEDQQAAASTTGSDSPGDTTG